MHVSPRIGAVVTTVGIVVAAGSVTGAAAGAAPVTSAAVASSSPWRQTDYNAALSRANLTEQTLTAATVGKMRYLRSVTAPPVPPGAGCFSDSPGQDMVAPLLTGGDLYAVTTGRITKYDAATGALIWRRNPDPSFSHVYQSLAVAGGLVIVGELDCGSASSPEGTIRAFNATTGAPVWTKPMPRLGALQQLVVSNGLVVAAGASEQSGLVITVRKLATGANVWTRSNLCILGQLMVVKQVVITPSCTTTDNVVGRNLTTGAVVWTRAGDWVLQRGDSDTTAGRHVFAINPSGTVVSLAPLTGKTQYSLAGAVSVLAVDGSQAYGACGSLNNDVCAYNTGTGRLRWQAKSFEATEPVLAAEAGGVLYVDQGAALDTTTGQVLTTLWGGGPPSATALAVGDGRVAAVTDPRVVGLYGLPGS